MKSKILAIIIGFLLISANVFAANGDLIVNGNVSIGTMFPGYKRHVARDIYTSGSYQGSDLRFKENITSIESPLAKIINTEEVSYNWKTAEYKDKGFPEGRHYGVIAQRVETILPEVVNASVTGEKSVAYTELVPVLIEAMKEQQAIISELKLTVQQLKKDLDK